MIVVSDTSPLNYLILIDCVHVLPALFGEVFVPPVVLDELGHADSPELIRNWGAKPPTWLIVQAPKHLDSSLQLNPGESQAIALAQELHADRLLMDETAGRAVATGRGLQVTGTLGVIEAAARRGLIALRASLLRLQQTSFRASPDLYRRLLSEP